MAQGALSHDKLNGTRLCLMSVMGVLTRVGIMLAGVSTFLSHEHPRETGTDSPLRLIFLPASPDVLRESRERRRVVKLVKRTLLLFLVRKSSIFLPGGVRVF